MKKAKIIQIGISGFGKSVALAVNKCKNIDLIGVYDLNKEATDEFSSFIGVKPYHSLEDVLASECDGVILEVPNHVHLELAKAAADAGKHICVEKPITNTIEEAREMIEYCKEKGVILQVGHSSRFSGKFRKVKELLDQNIIGRIVMIESNSSSERGKGRNANTWRAYRESCPGGPMLQLGIHSIDTIYYLTGSKPVDVKGFFSDKFTEIENDDVGMIAMRLENGTLAYVGSSYVSPLTNFMVIYGDEGKIEINHDGIHITKGNERTTVKVEEAEGEGFIRQFESFADCIINGKRPEVDGETGLQNLEVILKVLEQ